MRFRTVCFSVFLLGLILYAGTLRAGFYFDDQSAIVLNPAIKHLGNLAAVWSGFNTRFIVGFTFALNYAVGGLNPFGYHLVNIIFHIFSSLLVYQLASLTFKTPALKDHPLGQMGGAVSFFASLLFLVHPVQTEAVNFVWQRAASLATFFYLTAVVLYIRARLFSRSYDYVGSLAVTLLGMLTKEITVTIPLTLLLYECFFFRPRLVRLLPFLFTLAIIPLFLLRSDQVIMKLKPPVTKGEPFTETLLNMTRWSGTHSFPRRVYLLTEANVFRTYLGLFFFPAHQRIDYDYPIARTLSDPGTLFSCLLLAAILIAAVALSRRHRLISFGIFWFFITASVEALFILRDVIFEYRLYLPMAGFALFLPASVFTLFKDRVKSTAILSCFVFAFSAATYRRNLVWKDELSLWKDAALKSPRKSRVLNNLGMAYDKIGNETKAFACYKRAVKMNPRDAEAYNNMGILRGKTADEMKSEVYYRRAIAVKPDFAKAYNNLAVLYHRRSRPDEAARLFQKAIQLDPLYAEAHVNLGTSYLEMKEYEKAFASYLTAVEINPDYSGVYHALGVYYGMQGKYDEEISLYQKALRLGEKTPYLYNNLGAAYHSKGMQGEAIGYFEKALSLDPHFADAQENLKKLKSGIMKTEGGNTKP